MLHSLDDLVSRVRAVEKTMTPERFRQNLTKVGGEAKREANAIAAGQLGGDGAFSGWRRTKPITLGVAFTVHAAVKDSALILHRDKTSAGPFRVAEQGRNQGNAGGFSGPGINRTTGVTARTKKGKVRKVRATKGKRWNGTTAGKGTWTIVSAAFTPIPVRLTSMQLSAVADAFLGRKG